MITPNRNFRDGEDATKFSASDYRFIAEYLESLGALSVIPPLQLSNGNNNRIISFPHKRGFWAKVFGSANPYGFVELYRDDTFNLVANGSGYTGTNTPSVGDLTAYEVNNVVMLNGTTQWLEPGYDNDYRFQDVALGAAHPPPACPLTIRLLDCTGDPIMGATVTIDDGPVHVPPRTPITGTTDSDGKYTFPSAGPTGTDGRNLYSISWDGAILIQQLVPTFDSVAFCDSTVDFCYRHAIINVGTTAAADPITFTGSPWVETGDGTSTIVLTYKSIQNCAIPSYLPKTLEITVEPQPDTSSYLDNCTSVTVACDDSLTESLPLLKWTDNYAIYDITCDKGCATAGEGPNFRGLVPKVLFTTITKTSGLCSVGIYDGVPITVTWNGSFWDSGCLPAPGVRCCQTGAYGPFYGSARMQIFPTTVFGRFHGPFTMIFTMYCSSDCTTNPTCVSACPNYTIIAGTAGCTPSMYSPVDATFLTSGGGFTTYTLHITE